MAVEDVLRTVRAVSHEPEPLTTYLVSLQWFVRIELTDFP